MIIQYKLLKDLPDVKAGSVISSCGTDILGKKYWFYGEITISENIINNNPDWFAPYLFTTEDGVDIFKDDWFYILYSNNKIEKSRFSFFTIKNNDYKYFSTKEAAEEYLESLKPKFKVGDIIVDTFQNRNRIGVVDNIEKLSFDRPYVTCKDQEVPYLIEHCRLATDEDIITYEEEIEKNYKKQGWVEGAKFKHPDLRYAISMDRVSYCLRTNKSYVYSSEGLPRSYDMEDCELIKELQYPKNWEDLKVIEGYWITSGADITYGSIELDVSERMKYYKNIYSNRSQVQSALASAQLSQLHAATIAEYNRINNCDWKPDYTAETVKWAVSRSINHLEVEGWYSFYTPLAFPTKELAQFSLDNWKDLWKQYYEL